MRHKILVASFGIGVIIGMLASVANGQYRTWHHDAGATPRLWSSSCVIGPAYGYGPSIHRWHAPWKAKPRSAVAASRFRAQRAQQKQRWIIAARQGKAERDHARRIAAAERAAKKTKYAYLRPKAVKQEVDPYDRYDADDLEYIAMDPFYSGQFAGIAANNVEAFEEMQRRMEKRGLGFKDEFMTVRLEPLPGVSD